MPFAPVNYRLADDRLRSIVERVAPAFIVGESTAIGRIQGVDGVEVTVRDDLDARLEGLEPVDEGHTDPDAVAIWLFTSGTTGQPKAALLRHRHLVSYVLSTVEYMAAGEDEATLVSVPPYHVAGMAAILSATYSGRRIVYLPQFDPAEWVRLAEERRSPTPWWSPRCSGASSMRSRSGMPSCPRWPTCPTAAVACRCP